LMCAVMFSTMSCAIQVIEFQTFWAVGKQ
jgi:hypothetical protein